LIEEILSYKELFFDIVSTIAYALSCINIYERIPFLRYKKHATRLYADDVVDVFGE
jgi:hypothetical protein